MCTVSASYLHLYKGSSDKDVALQSKVMEMQKNGDLQRRWDSFTTQELSLSIVS